MLGTAIHSVSFNLRRDIKLLHRISDELSRCPELNFSLLVREALRLYLNEPSELGATNSSPSPTRQQKGPEQTVEQPVSQSQTEDGTPNTEKTNMSSHADEMQAENEQVLQGIFDIIEDYSD